MSRGLFIEPPLEEADAVRYVTPEEYAAAQAFACPRRRREFLTWRAIVHRELGPDVQIGYDVAGAPFLVGGGEHVGVAHCPGRVAVCISDAPCAVDIEPEARDFGRAANRFMSPAERALGGDALLPAAVWCAKETLYKYARCGGLDLLRDLHVEQVDFAAGTVVGRIREGKPLRMSLRRDGGFIIVYIL